MNYTAVKGHLNTPFFSFHRADTPAADSIFSKVEQVGGKIVLTLKDNIAVNSKRNLILYFAYDTASYDGAALPAQLLLTVNAKAYGSPGTDTPITTTAPVNTVSSSADAQRAVGIILFLPIKAASGRTPLRNDQVISVRVNTTNNYWYRNKFDSPKPVTSKIYLPKSTEVVLPATYSVNKGGAWRPWGNH